MSLPLEYSQIKPLLTAAFLILAIIIIVNSLTLLLKQAPSWPRCCLWPLVVYSHSSTQNSVGGPCLKVKAKISTIDFFPLLFRWLPLLFSYLFTVLQPHWPLCCSLNLLGMLLLHDLCFGYFLCLKKFFQIAPWLISSLSSNICSNGFSVNPTLTTLFNLQPHHSGCL